MDVHGRTASTPDHKAPKTGTTQYYPKLVRTPKGKRREEYTRIAIDFNKAFPASAPQHLSLGCCGAGLSHTSKTAALSRAHLSIDKIV